ncbi:MAG: hypothetical protein A2016_05310 [Elusimicrobia bacterium GWF2_62_30]|nr:MAG: hypothetical protein A2016_05310 [Elusimicrobia bacterium GWF2_62_30]
MVPLFLAMVAGVALAFNLLVCWKVYRNAPLREAASRSLMAEGSRFFYDSGFAEPLPVFTLKAAMALGADPDAAVRAEGLVLFAAITVVSFLFIRRRFGALAGAMAAMLLAGNPYLGYSAMRGGSHLHALFFILLFWYWFDSEKHTTGSIVAAGLAGGAACLSRLDSAWFVLISAVLFLAIKRRDFDLKAAGLSLGLAFLLLFPYLAYQKAKYGNSLYAQELSLRRWANLDRYGYNSAEPMPTGPLSVAGFLFRDGPVSAVKRTFGGLGRSFSFEIPKVVYYKLTMVLVFLGFYAAFALKKDSLLVFFAAAFLPVLALAPVQQIPVAGGIELRYYLSTLWGLVALAALGFQEGLEWAAKHFKAWLEGKVLEHAAKDKRDNKN